MEKWKSGKVTMSYYQKKNRGRKERGIKKNKKKKEKRVDQHQKLFLNKEFISCSANRKIKGKGEEKKKCICLTVCKPLYHHTLNPPMY